MRWPLLLIAALLFPVSAAATKLQPLPVGNWYGEGQPYSGKVVWLSHAWPDGRYKIEARTCLKGKNVGEGMETGKWGYHNGVMHIVTLVVDGHPSVREDSYHTLSYDGRKHTYRHVGTGYVFTGVRVAESFQLPACDLTG